MNPSQLIAWLICLGLAFFASAMSIRNATELKLVERRMEAVGRTAEEQTELLAEINQVLRDISGHLQRSAPAPAGAQNPGRASAPAVP